MRSAFFALLSQKVPDYVVLKPAAVTYSAHAVCMGLHEGQGSGVDATATLAKDDPEFTLGKARAYVNAAIIAYCPLYLQ